MAATHEAETEVGYRRQRGVGGTQLEDVSPCSRFHGLGARRTLRKAWGLIVVSWSPSTQARVTSVSDQRTAMSSPAPTETAREVSCTATSVRIGGGCVKRGCSTSITIARIAARVPPAVEPVDVDVDVEAAVLAMVTAVVQRSPAELLWPGNRLPLTNHQLLRSLPRSLV